MAGGCVLNTSGAAICRCRSTLLPLRPSLYCVCRPLSARCRITLFTSSFHFSVVFAADPAKRLFSAVCAMGSGIALLLAVALPFAVLAAPRQAQRFGAGSTSVAMSTSASSNVCGENPILGHAVLDAVNLTLPQLADVASHAQRGDLQAACDALATYYASSNTTAWLRWTPPGGWHPNGTKRVGGHADDILKDIYYLSGVKETAKIPRNSDGGLNWYDEGPKHDPEFMNCLNRHDAWEVLLHAWQSTGNPVYAQRFDALVNDWMTHLPCRDGVSRSNWTASGHWDKPCATGTMESPWRVLEAGIRTAGPWAPSFFGFQRSTQFGVSARVLMVLGMSEHLSVLQGPGMTAHTPNWVMTQLTGLVVTCVAFPELNGASEALTFAVDHLDQLLQDQVYPDGIETEEAFGYDMGTAGDFFKVLNVLELAGKASPSATFAKHVEAMYNYGYNVPDQQGFGPRNGDADLGRAPWSTTIQRYFNRSDWLYVHTAGKQGTNPTPNQSPSLLFPWGGQTVFKSGYQVNDTWAWFQVGPYGSSGHAHRAKLMLAVRAFGSMLLVDSGRFQYNGVGLSKTLHDEYSRTTHAHNTLTLDGKDQLNSPALTKSPVPTTSYHISLPWDYVRESMALWEGLDGFGNHTRAVFYKRSGYFVVLDRVETDKRRSVQMTWHAHPNASVSVQTGTCGALLGGVDPATGKPTAAGLVVVPASGAINIEPWTCHVVKGQNKTSSQAWQGWFSGTYDGADPAPTVIHDTATHSEARSNDNDNDNASDGNAALPPSWFAWLLVPLADAGDAGAINAHATLDSVSDNTATITVTVGNQTDRLVLPLEQPASSAHVESEATPW
eukprot:m.488563 g.488563  ORF g.488563 m.488563 type:complete len:838 (-) comp25909_c0_seq1:98-2611(-)